MDAVNLRDSDGPLDLYKTKTISLEEAALLKLEQEGYLVMVLNNQEMLIPYYVKK